MSRSINPTGCRRRVGLSMLEVVVSLTLIATIMLVSLTASANMMRNRVAAKSGLEAQILAGYFLDEISVLPFREPSDDAVFGPEVGESASNRSSFDDVDDYHGYRQTTPTFRDGQLIPNYSDWRVDVGIIPLALSGGAFRFSADAISQFRLVGVSVTRPDATVQTYRTIVSITSTDRPGTQSFERLRRVHVRFSQDREFDVVVPLRNSPAPVY